MSGANGAGRPVLCSRCDEEPASETLRLDPIVHNGRHWKLCEACWSLTLALLEGRPVFARGDERNQLIESLQAESKLQAGKGFAASDLLVVAAHLTEQAEHAKSRALRLLEEAHPPASSEPDPVTKEAKEIHAHHLTRLAAIFEAVGEELREMAYP